MNESLTIQQQSVQLPMVKDEKDLISIQMNPDKFPRYFQYAKEERMKLLQLCLLESYKIAHLTNLNKIQTDATFIDMRLKNHPDFSGLTFREIFSALANGASGLYGEVKLINTDIAMRWIAKFFIDHETEYRKVMAMRDVKKWTEDQRKHQNIIARYTESMERANRERMEKENNFKKL